MNKIRIAVDSKNNKIRNKIEWIGFLDKTISKQVKICNALKIKCNNSINKLISTNAKSGNWTHNTKLKESDSKSDAFTYFAILAKYSE